MLKQTEFSFPAHPLHKEDVHTLTTFGNPFPDEGEEGNSSYAIMSSLLSKVRNTFSAQSTPFPAGTGAVQAVSPQPELARNASNPRPTLPRMPSTSGDRSIHAPLNARRPAPPLISMTPVISEIPTYLVDPELPTPRNSDLRSGSPMEGDPTFNTGIPGFPIQDDSRSIRTSNSLKRSGTASKVIRRLRGDGTIALIPRPYCVLRILSRLIKRLLDG